MTSNLRSSAKCKAIDPNLRAVTLALAFSEDGDDDDFQNPSEGISATQNRMPSSLRRNLSSRTLRPSNDAPRMKRPKSSATRKENRAVSPPIEPHPMVSSGDFEERKEVEAVRSIFSCSTFEQYVLSSMREQREEDEEEKSIFVPETGKNRTTQENVCTKKVEKQRLWASTESKMTRNNRKHEDLKVPKGNYHLMSMEARLLESRAVYNCFGDDGTFIKGEENEDFEAGTQLKELMTLCSEGEAEGDLCNCASPLEGNDLNSVPSGLEISGPVECPLCGLDISDLSGEQRQVHTNDCLDQSDCGEVAHSIHETRSTLPGVTPHVNSVIDWIRNLGLSRYEDIFVREEIDWESLQWLTEEDLLNIGIVALGPRKKIVHAITELRKRIEQSQGVQANSSHLASNEKNSVPMVGNKLITEYFQCSNVDRSRLCSLSNLHNAKSQDSSGKQVRKKKHANKQIRGGEIPDWCCIPGTPFRVDAFRYLRGDCSHWFLTHFHLDHYQGLTRNFCHGKIYCSSITARLVNMKIGISWDRLHILPLNQKITVAGVHLVCFDANHCPGSIIILFEPPNGKAVLHTGDFRFSPEIANNSVLKSCHVHTLILDTTYCNPQYGFPKQEAVIQFVIEAIQAEAFNPKTLFLIGSYTIGKERLFLEVARMLRKKVYVGSAKLRLLKCLELPEEDIQWFTANEMESCIHVVPMWTLASFRRMKYVSNQYAGRFDLIVAFSPTGWAFGKGKKKTPGRRWQQGTIIRYEVPYSEHCSFTELQEFVKFISPEHIIPSVNNNGSDAADAMLALLMPDS